MTSSSPGRLILVLAILFFPTLGFAQEATVTGTVADSTGGVLPGVTVTALHEATGNTFLAVTDGRGTYRIAVRVGRYKMTMELPGFATVSQDLDLLTRDVAGMADDVRSLADDVNAIADALAGDDDDDDPRQSPAVVNGVAAPQRAYLGHVLAASPRLGSGARHHRLHRAVARAER